jgi:hypothetical protein
VFLLLILPGILAIAFLLIADIDSPRGGIIGVLPQNLVSLSQSNKAPRLNFPILVCSIEIA